MKAFVDNEHWVGFLLVSLCFLWTHVMSTHRKEKNCLQCLVTSKYMATRSITSLE